MTEAAKHTPGPWSHSPVADDRDPRVWVYGAFADGNRWRVVECDALDPDQSARAAVNLANARLIAAAPDMLAALTAMCDRFPYWFPHDSGHCDPAALALVTNARAAIAKATTA